MCVRKWRIKVWSRCSWCLLVLLLLLQWHCSAGCPPPSAKSKAGPDLNDMLVEAWQSNRQDDRITLARLAPSPDVADSVTYRPRLGKNVTFNCSVPADVDWRDVSWLHQDRTVYEAGRPVETSQDTTGQSYNFTRVNSTLFFSVLNVSTCVGGAVLCVATPSVPSNYSPRPRVLQRYQLLPLITRSSDVFAAPNASYITASEGDDVMVPCWIRLPLPEAILRNMRNHFMVRHNGRIVRGPPEAPYGPLLPASVPSHSLPDPIILSNRKERPADSPGQVPLYIGYFAAVKLADRGAVECWFRPHPGLHEWIVHTTALLVFPKNDTNT